MPSHTQYKQYWIYRFNARRIDSYFPVPILLSKLLALKSYAGPWKLKVIQKLILKTAKKYDAPQPSCAPTIYLRTCSQI